MSSIGAAEVARPPADSYAFMLSISDPLVAAAAMIKAIPYFPRSSFTFISKLANSGPVLVANMRVNANNLSELID
jgi:tripartite-type tricarboxylate transporter receptor subunit TctC